MSKKVYNPTNVEKQSKINIGTTISWSRLFFLFVIKIVIHF